MEKKHVNDGVPIELITSAQRDSYGAAESKKIRQTVSALMRESKETYLKAQVRVERGRYGGSETLVAFLLRAFTYTADVVRLVVDSHFRVRSVEIAVTGREEWVLAIAQQAGPIVQVHPPRRRVEMVFGTPVPEIPTAKVAVEYAYNVATAAGYSAVKLLGKNATVANYQAYLSGHLKAFGNIGHGFTGGIILYDGTLTSGWVSSLPPDGLAPAAIYFNSCQVYNAPLQPAIMAAGARTFAGGIVNLLIGPSEEVFKCFWKKVLGVGAPMGASLKTCEHAKYPSVGAHGIGGDLGTF